jgi:tetratricopeptide (TPR) repeat protein
VVRDAITGLPIAPPLQYDGWSPVNRAVFSPDDRLVLTSNSAGIACVWDVATGRPITPPLYGVGQGWDAAFSPDGRFVVVAYTGGLDGAEAKIWRVATGRLVFTLKHARTLRRAEFSPDGRLVVTASEDRTARIWEAATGHPLATLEHDGPVRHAGFSPDGRLVVTASDDQTARIWDVATGRPLAPPLPHRGKVKYAAFSPDGRLVVTASDDQTARIWDAATGRPGPILKHGSTVHNARFSPDGRRVLTAGSDGTARVWDTATGLPLTAPLKHRRTILHAWFSPDGRRLLTISVNGDGTRIWPLDRPDLAGRPVEDLMLQAQLLSGQTIDERGGSSPIEAATLRRAWERLRSAYPEDTRVTSEEVLAWHRHQVEDCANGGDLSTALGHLDRLIAAEPSFWPHHADRGNILARLGRYREAAADFARAIDQGGNHWWLAWRLGLAHLAVGDTKGCRRACETALARDGRSESPFPFSHADFTGSLAPGAVDDPLPLVARAERACAIAPRSDRFRAFLIAALYRAGRYEDAIQRADRAKAEGVEPFWTAWPFLAMAHARLGRHQEARELLDKSQARANSMPRDGPTWDQRLTIEILNREAEALLGATHSEGGKDQPARADPAP